RYVPMFDVESARSKFPALSRTHRGRPVAYLDGPGGTQVPASVTAAITGVLDAGVSNLGGGFASSELAEEITVQARRAGADLFGATDPEEIVFGQNMTSLTFSMSRALARTWRPGDRIIVTSLDHDANVSPWRMAAADAGVAVDIARFDSHSYTLDVGAVEELLTDRTRLVAVTHASNALGTIPDVPAIVVAAHRAGALTYVDAVHYAPHGVVDVANTGTDFLVASAYKFFGPHTGLLYGQTEHLDGLEAYKVRPAPDQGGGKWETGTQSFEALAGVTAAVDHLASLGNGVNRRAQLIDGHRQVDDHLRGLTDRFLAGLPDHITLYGIAGTKARTPTFAVNIDGFAPDEVAARLAENGLYVWSGHYYAIEPMAQLGLLDGGGAVRIGFVHTTTEDEVEHLLTVMATLRR
ncbi:MAG: cysteine desulfurase-like protein, partial [Acidimicrobiia bacterium]